MPASSETEDIEQLDKTYVMNTWSYQNDAEPIEIVDATGHRFTDADGNTYLDFSSQLVCANFGYSADSVVEAVAEQLKTTPFVSPKKFTTDKRAKLGEKLAEVTPDGLSKTMFSMSGAGANEAAIKIARWYTGKKKIASRYRSYHGATHGALSITGDPRRHYAESMPGAIRLPDPYEYGSDIDPMETLTYIDEALTLEDGTVAAVIVEPIVGGNGVIMPPEGYLSALKEIVHDHGALLIFDEVMTGFGRTGEWFAADLYDVTPDIMTLAKGMSGGYAPLGGTIVSDEIASHFDENLFCHGHSYAGHPLNCAAGLAAIEKYQDDNLIQRSRELGPYLNNKIEELAEAHPSVGDTRGIGLMQGIELSQKEDQRSPFATRENLFDRESTVVDEMAKKAFKDGLYIYTRLSCVVLAPPLTITKEEIDEAISILDNALAITDEAMS